MGIKNNKLRMLYVLYILRSFTDENHPLSSYDICEKLADFGIDCDRKATIYDDINCLIEFRNNCYNIEKVSMPKKGFCIYEREFELPELYFLCDAIQSTPFLTQKKAKNLISSLEQFSSVYQRKEIGDMVYIDKRKRCENDLIYINIDHIHKAIITKKKIKIEYSRRQFDKVNKKNFTVSPYAMIWSEDKYYLICNNDTKENLMHLRIDRIKNISLLDEPARSFELFTNYRGKFDTADYANKIFNAFAGEVQRVELICENEIFQEVIDRFGSKGIRKYDSQRFIICFSGALSGGLVNWLMQFGDKIIIKEPKNLQSLFNNKLQDIYEFQKKN